MGKYTRASLVISIIHFSIIGLLIINLFASGNQSDGLPNFMIPILFYGLLSFLPPLSAIALAIMGYRKESSPKINLSVIIACAAYEVFFAIFFYRMWSIAMGI